MQMADEESDEEYESGRCPTPFASSPFVLVPGYAWTCMVLRCACRREAAMASIATSSPCGSRSMLQHGCQATLQAEGVDTDNPSCRCLSPAAFCAPVPYARPIVIDNGTGRIKAGFADDEAPKVSLVRALLLHNVCPPFSSCAVPCRGHALKRWCLCVCMRVLARARTRGAVHFP
jgi:hypothetical protein